MKEGLSRYVCERCGCDRQVWRTGVIEPHSPPDYAAGYAAAVADVQKLIRANTNHIISEASAAKSKAFKHDYATAVNVLVRLGDIIEQGAHVGAKKGAT